MDEDGEDDDHIHTHTHSMAQCSAIKKNERVPLATTWMSLEMIMLSEVSQRKTNTIRNRLHGESAV